MSASLTFSLVPLREGMAGDALPLDEGATVVGRDAGCGICLPDPSVSRRHAEFVRRGDSIYLQDLNSRNGIHVNGVPRRSASLKTGDVVRVGDFEFKLAAGAAPADAPRRRRVAALGTVARARPDIEVTLRRDQELPASRPERHRDTLYHVCFWLTEGYAEEDFRDRCLALLRQSFDAEVAQYYDDGRELRVSIPEGKKRPPVKLAGFLAERFQQMPEAAIVTGESIRAHQRQVGGFNYLVGPIRRGGAHPSAACPFLVVARPADWADFDAQDRVLLQAVCQLWARTLLRVREARDIREENEALRQKTAPPGPGLRGRSVAMEQLRARAVKAARTSAPILLEGETGSGKEVVAHFIHEHSPRSGASFVKMNCAAIPEGLIESELFGHIKGAFTDAKGDRRGKFEQAHGGTLFLDEIGEMPAAVQAKVLRALENGEIEKLGSEAVQKVDVRVVAATHRNLKDMAARREFREDLYYRMSVMTVKVPALRDHLDDLDDLASHFLERFCEENGLAALKFSGEALAVLRKHSWPGNIRELRNVVQRCAVEAAGPVVTAADAHGAL